MANSKLFTIAGTSTLNGVDTFRFATGKIKVRKNKLAKTGHSNIALQDLPSPMTKAEAVSFLQGQGINAVLPRGRGAAVKQEQTPEQVAAAEKADKASAFAKRMAEARAAKAAARQAAEDAAFFAAQAGDTAGAAALLAAADEHGVEAERELAIAEGAVEG